MRDFLLRVFFPDVYYERIFAPRIERRKPEPSPAELARDKAKLECEAAEWAYKKLNMEQLADALHLAAAKKPLREGGWDNPGDPEKNEKQPPVATF